LGKGAAFLVAALVTATVSMVPARAADDLGCGWVGVPIVELGNNPRCFDWQGSWRWTDVTITSARSPGTTYDATVFAPPLGAYSGLRPAVVMQHGYQGNKHVSFWAARFLASHGYVVVADTATDDVNAYVTSIQDMIDWLGSTAN